MTDTEKKIAEIREALDAATPGPWGTFDGAEVFPLTGEKAHVTLCNVFGLNGLESDWYKEHEAKANGFLIANSPEWIRFLLSELDREREENQKLREERDDLSFREREAYGAFKYWFGAWQEVKKENGQLQEQLQSAQHEIKRLEQECDKLIEGLRWYAQRNDVNTVSLMLSDKGQRARDILHEIGVTVE